MTLWILCASSKADVKVIVNTIFIPFKYIHNFIIKIWNLLVDLLQTSTKYRVYVLKMPSQ